MICTYDCKKSDQTGRSGDAAIDTNVCHLQTCGNTVIKKGLFDFSVTFSDPNLYKSSSSYV